MIPESYDALLHVCGNVKNTTGILYTEEAQINPNEYEDFVLWSDSFREKSFDHACKIKWCNLPGIRFSDGEWMQLNYPKDMDSAKTMWIRSLPICDPNAKISFADTYAIEHYTIDSVLAVFFYSKCLDTLNKLNMDEPVSPLDISHLAQVYSGIGPYYLLTSSGLMTDLSEYVLLESVPISSEGSIIGWTKDNETVEFKNWQWIHGTDIGPNGLIKDIKGRLIFPRLLEIRSVVDEELTRGVTLTSLSKVNPTSIHSKITQSNSGISDPIDQLQIVELTAEAMGKIIDSLTPNWYKW